MAAKPFGLKEKMSVQLLQHKTIKEYSLTSKTSSKKDAFLLLKWYKRRFSNKAPHIRSRPVSGPEFIRNTNKV